VTRAAKGRRPEAVRRPARAPEPIARAAPSAALVGALIVAATLLAYLPALQAGFIWDDDQYVTGNPTLRTLAGLGRIWVEPGATPQYYPLTFTTFWIEHALFGLAPAGYHLTNVLLHAANALLVWRLLDRLAVPGAWLAAALFAVHPVHVESVAWITERKNVLSGACYLGALLAYLPIARLAPGTASAGRYAAALALFAASLLAKTVTCTLPVVVLLLVWWKRGRIRSADVLPLLPFFAVGATLAGVTVWMERHHVGAAGQEWALTPAERLLIAGRAVWFYLAKLVWPWPLTFVYQRWQLDTASAWQWLFPLATLGALVALAALRRRIGPGPLVAALFFGVSLAPALGFVDVYPMRYTFVADHYQYLASLGPLALAAAGLARLRPPTAPALGLVIGVLAALGFAGRSWGQAHVYHDAGTLWRDTLAKDPTSLIGHVNLGSQLEQYRAVLAIAPDDADAHNDLGSALVARGRADEGMAELLAAVRGDPTHAAARNNLGNLLASRGRLDEAIEQYRQAVRLRPGYPDAHSNLANALVLTGHADEGLVEYAEALRLDPDYVDAHYNYATVLESRGAVAAAETQYREVLRLRPGSADAHLALGRLLAAQGPNPEAVAHFREALRLRPGDAEAQAALAAATGR
jgi:tetratricopeptide (TPR) repeat protein